MKDKNLKMGETKGEKIEKAESTWPKDSEVSKKAVDLSAAESVSENQEKGAHEMDEEEAAKGIDGIAEIDEMEKEKIENVNSKMSEDSEVSKKTLDSPNANSNSGIQEESKDIVDEAEADGIEKIQSEKKNEVPELVKLNLVSSRDLGKNEMRNLPCWAHLFVADKQVHFYLPVLYFLSLREGI